MGVSERSVGKGEKKQYKMRIAMIKRSKTVHFSVDDTIWIFENLGHFKYQSIFEQPVLSFFLRMHKLYGITVSFYCFGEFQGLFLNQMTTDYKEQFTANSSWMRFGFHAADDKVRYDRESSQKAAHDYANVIHSLGKIVGEEAIDHFVRIHCYAANIAALQAMREQGLKGCLCGMDKALETYDLGCMQKALLSRRGSCYDKRTEMRFLRTDLRMEKISSLEEEVETIVPRKHLEIFTHEWALDEICQDKILYVCKKMMYSGHRWNFPMEHNKTRST